MAPFLGLLVSREFLPQSFLSPQTLQETAGQTSQGSPPLRQGACLAARPGFCIPVSTLASHTTGALSTSCFSPPGLLPSSLVILHQGAASTFPEPLPSPAPLPSLGKGRKGGDDTSVSTVGGPVKLFLAVVSLCFWSLSKVTHESEYSPGLSLRVDALQKFSGMCPALVVRRGSSGLQDVR